MPNVSLILAGAVSLGSFEAGVLDELLWVLHELNDGVPEGEKYRIDSIAGASAGSMTAALVAQAVMRGFEKRSLLRRAWVDEIDIAPLLEDVPGNALLSKAVIDRIGREFLPLEPAGPPSSLAAETLRMAFTVTNLNGVNYRLARSSDPDDGSTFESTFHAERREFTLHRDRPDDDAWAAIREAAIASGNFPVAFAPHELGSDPKQWPGHSLPGFPDTFWYVDGGMFNNEPVGEAVRLARKVDDPAAGIDPGRIFLLVDANLNRPTHDADLDGHVGLPATGMRLVTAMMGEATANDWLKALRRNNEVEWRDGLVDLVARLVRGIAAPDYGLRERVAAEAEAVVSKKRDLFGADRYPADYRVRAVRRLTTRFADRSDGMTDAEQDLFGNLVFLVNSVAGLDRKDRLNLHMIHADEAEVAGDQLFSFGGFLSHDWRSHDYTVGRVKARAALPWVLDIDPAAMPGQEPGVPYTVPDHLGDVTLAAAPEVARRRLLDAAMARVDGLAEHYGLGFVKRFIARKIAKGALKKRLGL